jgi:hypothetical protein
MVHGGGGSRSQQQAITYRASSGAYMWCFMKYAWPPPLLGKAWFFFFLDEKSMVLLPSICSL